MIVFGLDTQNYQQIGPFQILYIRLQLKLLYRIYPSRYSANISNILSGESSKYFGGRWNFIGVPVIYTSETPELAFLETVVHLPNANKDDFNLVTLEIPDDIKITTVDLNILPKNWANEIDNGFTSTIGDNWIKNDALTILKVPNAIINSQCNYVINAKHSSKIKIISIEPLSKIKLISLKKNPIFVNNPKVEEKAKKVNDYKFDVFISHASEDKASVVEPIVKELKLFGLKYWYDKEQFKIGDSISNKIGSGIESSRFFR